MTPMELQDLWYKKTKSSGLYAVLQDNCLTMYYNLACDE